MIERQTSAQIIYYTNFVNFCELNVLQQVNWKVRWKPSQVVCIYFSQQAIESSQESHWTLSVINSCCPSVAGFLKVQDKVNDSQWYKLSIFISLSNESWKFTRIATNQWVECC